MLLLVVAAQQLRIRKWYCVQQLVQQNHFSYMYCTRIQPFALTELSDLSFLSLHCLLIFLLCGSRYRLMKALETACRVFHGMSKFLGNTKLWLWRWTSHKPVPAESTPLCFYFPLSLPLAVFLYFPNTLLLYDHPAVTALYHCYPSIVPLTSALFWQPVSCCNDAVMKLNFLCPLYSVQPDAYKRKNVCMYRWQLQSESVVLIHWFICGGLTQY